MKTTKEMSPALPSKEQLIMAIAGAFNLSNMFSAAGEQKEAILLNNTLRTTLLFATEFFYSDSLPDLTTDLYTRGIISDKGVVYRLLGKNYPKTNKKNKEEISTSYPIIGIVGRGNAGKETVGKILGENYDAFHFVLADRLREVAVILGIYPPFTLPLLREIDAQIKPEFGKEVFVRWTLNRAGRISNNLRMPEIISVDGFRSVKETEWFLRQPNTILVAITAPPQLRFKRGIDRNRLGEDSSNHIEFKESDKIEGEWIDPILDLAEHIFENNGSLEELRNKVENYFSTRLVV